jgi:hypothetical protein
MKQLLISTLIIFNITSCNNQKTNRNNADHAVSPESTQEYKTAKEKFEKNIEDCHYIFDLQKSNNKIKKDNADIYFPLYSNQYEEVKFYTNNRGEIISKLDGTIYTIPIEWQIVKSISSFDYDDLNSMFNIEISYRNAFQKIVTTRYYRTDSTIYFIDKISEHSDIKMRKIVSKIYTKQTHS